ncbi:MAG: DUF937 domain-containing protein [Hyphomicrobiales bacterium]|nr:DUF937 domain-containing protein [Hyphomicrobiales bacterium]
MLPLFDMIANAQNGNGIEALSRQFGLSNQQTQAALQALMPAFSQGLKRNASDPYGMADFMKAMANGQHAKYFEDAAQANSPKGVAEGNGILGHLFGSKDLSRAVTSQAAQMTGIGQNILAQMLPVIASMIMGGLFKQSTGQMSGAGSSAGGGLLGQIMEQMMGGGAPNTQASAPGSGAGAENPFGKMLEGMFGGGAGQAGSAGMAGNPWGKMLEDMLGGGQATQPSPQASPAPKANPGGQPGNPYGDLFGKMFEAGSNVRDEHEKAMGSIFDQFMKGMDRRA